MHFLVEYESVNDLGLHGTELLKETDTVTIFYGNIDDCIAREYIDQIQKSKCGLDFICVDYHQKNALDFYMTSFMAELLLKPEEQVQEKRIAVISKDKNFCSVQSYWEQREKKCQIVCAQSLLAAMAEYDIVGERKNMASHMLQSVSIKQFYHNRSNNSELERLLGTDIQNKDEILSLIEQNISGQELYLHLIKLLGKNTGLSLYYRIKAQKQSEENATGF